LEVREPSPVVFAALHRRNDLLIVKALRRAMEKKTIVLGAEHGYQAPASLVYRVPASRLDGKAWRILFWMLWEAHARSRWGRVEDPQVDLEVRYHPRTCCAAQASSGRRDTPSCRSRTR
jgi:hypothetical protein